MTQLSRRKAVAGLGAGALWALGLWPGVLRSGDANRSGKIRFIVVNDTHYLSEGCGAWLAGVIQLMRAEKPDFCLHAGDLTEHGQRAHLGAMRDVLATLGCPFYVVPGNHDYETATSAAAYDALFEKRRNYSFATDGWQIVALDSTEGQRYEQTSVQAPTRQWLRDELPRLDRALPTILFTHFPLGDGVKYRPTNADQVLDCFRDFNLQAIYCGHFHGFTERKCGAAPVFTNRCCALKRANHDRSKEKGFFVCTAEAGRVTTRFVEVKTPAPA